MAEGRRVSATGSGWQPHLEELYAASCVYLSDPGRAEHLLRHVLSTSDRIPGATDRVSVHRTVYQAAVDAGARSAPPRPRGSRLERALARLSLRARAAVFLVDACGLRYPDVARVLGVTADSIGATVASGRRRLRTILEAHRGRAPARRLPRRPALRH